MQKTLVATVVIAGLISACAPPTPRPTENEGQTPAGFPEQYYERAIERRTPVFRVDPAVSIAVIEVRRGGSLARLGHDHVIASHDVRGYVAPDERRSDLYVRLDRLVVDEPALRAEAGFDTEPAAADVAGTRQNMLDKVLQAERHPFALINVTRIDTGISAPTLNVSITLHGTTREFQVPVKLETGAERIDVSGRMAFNQTDFGIVPFSILGGAVQVLDHVNLRFRIRAHRIDD